MKYLKGLFINLQFFTAIPIAAEFPMDHEHLKKAVQTFPILGLFQGLVYSLLFYFFIECTPFSHLADAFLLWLAMILLPGGIHLDGWMDASDAYFSYRDQEKRLEIMKDPRTGAFGVISIIILLSCRFIFLYEFTMNIGPITYLLIAAVPFFSKTVMGVLLVTVKPAKNEGLGSLFQRAAVLKDLWVYALYVTVFLALSLPFFPLMGVVLAVSIGCYLFSRRKTMKWFGGMTGDVIGAAVEGMELILWMAVWLLHYFATF